MGEQMLEPSAPGNTKEPVTSIRFRAGVCLIILNMPMGLGGAAFAGAMAVRTGHKAFWAGIGVTIYALSWVMLGLGLILSGKQGVQYAKELKKKWFKHGE